MALLLSQFANIWVLLDDQRTRMKSAWAHGMFERVLTAKELIDTTPPEVWPKILKSIDNRALVYKIAGPGFGGDRGESRSGDREQLTKVFHADEVRGAVDPIAGSQEPLVEFFFGDLWRDFKRTFFPQSLQSGSPPRPAYARLSVPLHNGEWLNAVMTLPGLAPHASPLLTQFATMLALSTAGIILVLGGLTRPLKEMANAASRLGRGETSGKLCETGPREIADTIRALNEMQERLTTFVHDRAKMLAALGHDLRTPIADASGLGPSSSKTMIFASTFWKPSTRWRK